MTIIDINIHTPKITYKSITCLSGFADSYRVINDAIMFHLDYPSLRFSCIYGNLQTTWPTINSTKIERELSAFCAVNKLVSFTENIAFDKDEKPANNSGTKVQLTKESFIYGSFFMYVLLVDEELFFFSTVEDLGLCLIDFSDEDKEFFSGDFIYENFSKTIKSSKKEIKERENREIEYVDKIKSSLESFFHTPQV